MRTIRDSGHSDIGIILVFGGKHRIERHQVAEIHYIDLMCDAFGLATTVHEIFAVAN